MAKYESLEEFIGNLESLDSDIPGINLQNSSDWSGSGISIGFEGR